MTRDFSSTWTLNPRRPALNWPFILGWLVAPLLLWAAIFYGVGRCLS